MNEENNQNTPILRSNEGGGGIVPISSFSSGTYKIKFSDEYYLGLNDTDKLIKGRIMLIQNDDVNNGNYFVNRYIIFDDIFIDEYVSHFDTEDWMPILGDGLFEEHSGIYLNNIPDYQFERGTFNPNIEYHFVLDEEWYNKHYGDDSNKILRTLATGQSDITRHEAYTKVTGLNEFNSLSPSYINSSSSLILKLMLEIVKTYIPLASKIVLYTGGLYKANSIYNENYAYVAAIIPEQYEEDGVTYSRNIISVITSEGTSYDYITVGCSTNQTLSYTYIPSDDTYFISTTCTEGAGIETGALNSYAKIAIPSTELAKLCDLSNDLIGKNVDFYYTLSGK